MQGDGNFVLYNGSWAVLWHTSTGGHPGAWLRVEDDGRIVIYSAGGTELTSRPLPTYTLSLVKEGDGAGDSTVTSMPGGMSCGGTCSAGYEAGTTVTLGAEAAPGYLFMGWSGDAGCWSGTVSMDGPKTCVATFAADVPLCDPDGSQQWDCENNGGRWDSETCSCQPLWEDPLILFFENGPPSLTGLSTGVLFDVDGDGRREPVAWTAGGSMAAFLTLDRNGNGVIDSGVELFGRPASGVGQGEKPAVADNGFARLAELDQIATAAAMASADEPVVAGLRSAYPTAPKPPAVVIVHYYHTDALGSVRVVTDALGREVARHDFKPFGEEVAPTNPPTAGKLFAGQLRDVEVKQDYLNARQLSFRHGRFAGPDPLDARVKLANPQSLNRYAYVLNNPLRFVDPRGLDEEPSQDYAMEAGDRLDPFDLPGERVWGALTLWEELSIAAAVDDILQKANVSPDQGLLTTLVYNEISSLRPNPTAAPNTAGSAADLHNARVATAEVVVTVIKSGHRGRIVVPSSLPDREVQAIKSKGADGTSGRSLPAPARRSFWFSAETEAEGSHAHIFSSCFGPHVVLCRGL